VGNSGSKDLKPLAQGAKFWITPVRREILVDFDCQLGVRAEDPALLERMVAGLAGRLDTARYGLPFAGDNNFLLDRIDVLETPLPARWYELMGSDSRAQRGSCRLTVGIDRADSSRTSTMLFAPSAEARSEPGALAWTWTPRMTPAG
jgi:CRISPR-associated protein Cas5t